jgi:CRP-like cAMP-binding protein
MGGLAEPERRRLLASATRKRFAKGAIVFHEGDVGEVLHLIESGRFATTMTAPSGEVVTLAILGPGDFFGERALLDASSRRTATVTALEAGETLSLGRREFAELRASDPSVDRFLVNLFAVQAKHLSEELIEALHLPAERRVLRRLLAAARTWGTAESPARVVPLTQEDLASLAGTTRQTVNQVMRDAEARGLVATSRGRIEILEPDGLAARART